MHREIREELGSEIQKPKLLGVVENPFTFDGKQGHELVFVYSALLTNKSLHQSDRFIGQESNGYPYNAIWIDIDLVPHDSPPIYPQGLIDLLNDYS